MRREVDIYTGLSLVQKALEYGKVLNDHKFQLNYEGSCDDPVLVEYIARNERTPVGVLDHDAESIPTRAKITWLIDVYLRCRKCEPCRKAKRRLWAYRAVAEWEHAPRTWFLTLTFPEDVQYLAQCRAGINQTWSPEHKFQKVAGELSRDVTRYLKRVRQPLVKNGWEKVQFKYLLVAEAHARQAYDGTIYDFDRPHFHLLIHEMENQPIVHRRLKHHWPYISDAKLVHSTRDCWYVTKYTAKEDGMSRVRASHAYGMPFDPEGIERDSRVNTTADAQTETPPHPLPEPRNGQRTAEVNTVGDCTNGADIPYALNDCVDPETGERFIPGWDHLTE